MSQTPKTCDSTPFDWSKVKLEVLEEQTKVLLACGKADAPTFYHHLMLAFNLVRSLSQRAVDQIDHQELRKDLAQTALGHQLNTLRRIKPQDPMEEMLIGQAMTAHGRVMYLTRIMLDSDEIEVIQRMSEAADRAANTFRRQMLALREYRRPTKTVQFVRQNNVANQQVVSNSFSETENATNEQGFDQANGQETPALPSDARRADPLTGISKARQTVDAEHGSEDCRGEGPIEDERTQTRRKKRTPSG